MDNVPRFNLSNRHKVRRFILFIDEVYNHRKRVLNLSEYDLGDICEDELLLAEFEESFAWQRALSRLTEMQGTLYRPNITHKAYGKKDSDYMLKESDII